MTDPRWTAETRDACIEAAVRTATCKHVWDYQLTAPCLECRTDAILAALADAGLLLPPDGEVRQEWTVEVDDGNGWRPTPRSAPYITTDRESQSAYVADIDAYMRSVVKYPKRKVTRTVHTGPWRPVDAEEGTDG